MKDNTTAKKVSKIDRLINGIEAVCNKLPPRPSFSAGCSCSLR